MAGVFDHRLRPVPSPVYDRPNPRRGSSHDVPGGARQRNIPHDEPRHPPNTGAGSAPWPNFEHRTDGQRADAAGSDPDRRRRRMGRRPVGRHGHGGRLRYRHARGARRQTTDLEPVDPEDLQALRTPYERYTAPAVGTEIVQDKKALVTVGAREPEKGRLELPGGFLEVGEHTENGTVREVREELGVEIELVGN